MLSNILNRLISISQIPMVYHLAIKTLDYNELISCQLQKDIKNNTVRISQNNVTSSTYQTIVKKQ